MIFNNYPKQRELYSKKKANDFQWGKDMVDALSDYYYHGASERNYSGVTDYDRMLSNYRLYNNDIDKEMVSREFDLLGVDEGDVFQDRIQPYNKTYNKIDVLLGEEKKRPFNYQAVLVNDEALDSYQTEKTKLLRDYINAEYERQRLLLESMMNEDLTDEERQIIQQEIEETMASVLSPDEIQKQMDTTYLEAREITANKLLKYFKYKELLVDKKMDGYKHGLIAGKEFVYVGVHNQEPYVEMLNPLNVFYHKSPDTKFVEDGLFAGSHKQMHPHEILDRWRNELKPDEIERLEGRKEGTMADLPSKSPEYKFFSTSKYLYERGRDKFNAGQYERADYELWDIIHVEWRSERKVGFLTYLDEAGMPQETVVDESFKFDESLGHLDIQWEWVPEIWEGTRVGDDIYVNLQRKPHQYFSMEKPYEKAKLGYHGIVYSNTNAFPISLMDRMKPFQFLYFVVMNKLQELIRDDLGKIMLLDSTMIDKKIGLEKTLYYLKALKIKIYNTMQDAEVPGATTNRSVPQNTMDMSNAAHILNYIGILDALDRQIGEVAGISREREGQTSTYDAVTNAQQNIIQSGMITEIYFAPHNQLWQNILNSLVNAAQIAYAEGTGPKVWMEGSVRYIITSEDIDKFVNEEYGVFVTDNVRDSEIFKNMQQLTHALIQNDKANLSTIMKMMRSDSFEELEREIEGFEKVQEQMAQQEQEMAMQMQQQAQQAERDRMERQHQQELEKIDREGYWSNLPQETELEEPDDLDEEKLELERDKFNYEKQKDSAERQHDIKKLEKQGEIQKEVKRIGNKSSSTKQSN